MTPTRLIVLLLIVVAVVVAGVGAYVVYRPTAASGRPAAEQIKWEEERLKTLELLDEAHKVTGDKFSPAEAEELRQLRERAARRKIEKGY